MANTKNPMRQIDEQFTKEEKELDEEIEQLKRDQQKMRQGPLSLLSPAPKNKDEGPYFPGLG
jgi:hypothetical protein